MNAGKLMALAAPSVLPSIATTRRSRSETPWAKIHRVKAAPKTWAARAVRTVWSSLPHGVR